MSSSAKMITFRISCAADGHTHVGNCIHTIGLTRKGQLVALDHSPKLRRERNFADLGGDLPSCYHAVKMILAVDAMAVTLPMDFQAIAREAMAKRKERTERKLIPTERYMTPLEKYTALTQLAVAQVFPQKCYWLAEKNARVPTYKLPAPGSYSLDVKLYKWPREFPGDDSARLARFVKGEPILRLALPSRWLLNVHAKGIAVCGGCLVLDANWRGDQVDLMVLHQNKQSPAFHALLAPNLPAQKILSPRGRTAYFQVPWELR